MNIFGFNIIESDAVPADKMFVVPPWIGECRILAGVAVRHRRTETRNGETRKIYTQLTEDEMSQIAVLNNISIA